MSITYYHEEKIRLNFKLQKLLNSNNTIKIYIYLNGETRYQTISVGILPKIIGTSYNKIIEIDPISMSYKYITNIELAKYQGYTINLRDINFKSFISRIIGNSIPKIFIEAEINNYINYLKISKPSVGVIGGYGLEGLALTKYNFKFLTITNHINTGYLSSDNIKLVLTNNNPPNNIYEPNNYHSEKVDILIWKFPCQYGSTQNRNSNTKKQTKYKDQFEAELTNNYKYIQEYSPKFIMIELPSNINHSCLGDHNIRKIDIFKILLGKDYTCEYYAFNTKDYGLRQNRRSYIVRFKLNLPNNIIRGYDSARNKNFYYNKDTQKSCYNMNEL